MQRQSRFGITLLLSSLLFAALVLAERDALRAQDIVTLHLPLVSLSTITVDKVVAQGRLTLGGAPLSNTPFEIRTCNGNDDQLLASGVTDNSGAYRLSLPNTDPATPLNAMLIYPAAETPPARGTLASFTSVCVPSQGPALHLPDIDLDDAEFLSPAKDAVVDMPILFSWAPRAYPGIEEMYQLIGTIHYDCANCEPVEIAAIALPHPSSSILLECVYNSRSVVRSAEFRLMVSNSSGVGYSDPYAFKLGRTQRCVE